MPIITMPFGHSVPSSTVGKTEPTLRVLVLLELIEMSPGRGFKLRLHSSELSLGLGPSAFSVR